MNNFALPSAQSNQVDIIDLWELTNKWDLQVYEMTVWASLKQVAKCLWFDEWFDVSTLSVEEVDNLFISKLKFATYSGDSDEIGKLINDICLYNRDKVSWKKLTFERFKKFMRAIQPTWKIDGYIHWLVWEWTVDIFDIIFGKSREELEQIKTNEDFGNQLVSNFFKRINWFDELEMSIFLYTLTKENYWWHEFDHWWLDYPYNIFLTAWLLWTTEFMQLVNEMAIVNDNILDTFIEKVSKKTAKRLIWDFIKYRIDHVIWRKQIFIEIYKRYGHLNNNKRLWVVKKLISKIWWVIHKKNDKIWTEVSTTDEWVQNLLHKFLHKVIWESLEKWLVIYANWIEKDWYMASLRKVINIDWITDFTDKTIASDFLRKFEEAKVWLDEIRKPSIWLYSVWAKIHFTNPLPDWKLEEFQQKFNFWATPFKLIHANTSLLLPPCHSATELAYILLALTEFGIIDNNPELQICVPWRLPNRLAWILWSATILLSRRCKLYTVESFKTTHDIQTWARMMAYDAWVLDKGFSYNPDWDIWRTDILGRNDINDVFNYQLIWSLLSQTVYGWMFESLGNEFIRDYEALLDKYNMLDILDWNWIYSKSDDTEQWAIDHHELIKRCTDKWNSDADNLEITWNRIGLKFEFEKLLTIYYKKIIWIQNNLLTKQ